ncbi:unnamed protein product [Dicrocoelium dendriticum]|nr:unnamed protein product [Dicrocoelium dendriticum]
MIAPDQHGLRQKRSCTTNLLIAYNSWTEAVAGRGARIDVIHLDFSKAFDRLKYAILLHKIKVSGVGDSLLRWTGNFLHKGRLKMKVREPLSDAIEMKWIVPKDSVLGSRLLF